MERGDFDEAARAVFVAALSRGETLETAARRVSVGRSSIYYWLRASPAFKAAVEVAVAEGKASRKGPTTRVIELTPALAARLVSLAETGATRSAIAREAELGARTLQRWVTKGLSGEPPFRQFVLDLSAAEQRARHGPSPEPQPAAPPSLRLVPPAPVSKPAAPKPSSTSRVHVDTRTPYRKEVIREAVRAAGIAIADGLEPPGKGGARVQPGTVRRFDRPECWGALRAALHVLDADTRACALAALTMEHIDREEQAAGLAWTPHSSVTRGGHE